MTLSYNSTDNSLDLGNATQANITAQNTSTPPVTPGLEQLKEIHIPAPITLWPPAPSVWVALLVMLILAWITLSLLSKKIRRGALKRTALTELRMIKARALPEHERLNALATLVRRISISRFKQQDVASLSGVEWLTFLDRSFDPSGRANLFREGHGQLLGDARYAPETSLDIQQLTELQQLIKRWVVRVC